MTREVAVISVPGHDAYTVTILDYPVADPDDVTHSDDIDFPDLESALSFAKLQ